MESKKYYAKVLLFGEYTVIEGSRALAMPTTLFSGEWSRTGTAKAEDKSIWSPFLAYLEKENLDSFLDLAAFSQWIERGGYFASDIPRGYGLGSSGALCAAVYDRFQKVCPDLEAPNALFHLKKELASMESFFHGASSGVDPLICYLAQALLLDASAVRRVDIPFAPKAYRIFLLDTQISRQTEPLVELYKEKTKVSTFRSKVQQEWKPANDAAIEAILQADSSGLWTALRQISHFQYTELPALIPPRFQSLWHRGLETEKYLLKLCGAGGGGFMLGFTRDQDATQRLLAKHSLLWL